jgi:hypothetical protein
MGTKTTTLLCVLALSFATQGMAKGKNERKRKAYAEEQRLKEEAQLSDTQRAVIDGQDAELTEEQEDKERRGIFGGRIDFDKVSEKLEDVLQTTSVNFSLDFLDYATGGTSIGAKYRYEDKPSYVGGNYTRADLWGLDINTNFLNWFTEDTLVEDFSFNPYFDMGINLFFARQHKEERPGGLIKMPLYPTDVPLTAEKAMAKLEINDFFALPSHVDIGLRVGYRNPIASSVTVGGNMYYRLGRADLMINVFRESEKAFNVKVIAIKRKGHGMHGYLDLFYGLTGNEKFDDFLMDDIIGTNLFSINAFSNEVGDLHISDYTLDLTDEGAAEAYAQMFKKMFTIQRLKLLNPFVGKKAAKELIAEIIAPIEGIHQANNKVAQRNFVGSFRFNNDPFNIRVGQKIAKYERNTNYVENRVRYLDKDGKPVYFLNTYYSYHTELSFLWGLIETTRDRTSSMILFTDKDYQVVDRGLSDYRVTDQHTDQWAFNSDQQELKEIVEGNIGKTISAKVPWDDFITKDKQEKLRVRVEMIIQNEALYELRESNNVEQIRGKLDAYLSENNDFKDSILSLPIINWFSGRSLYHRKRIAETLLEGLNKETYVAIQERIKEGDRAGANAIRTKTRYEKARNYVLLERMSLFKDEGLGFIMSLFDGAGISLEDNVYVKLTWSSDEKDERSFVFGEYPESSKIYRTLEYALSILGGRTFNIQSVRDSTFKANLEDRQAPAGLN